MVQTQLQSVFGFLSELDDAFPHEGDITPPV